MYTLVWNSEEGRVERINRRLRRWREESRRWSEYLRFGINEIMRVSPVLEYWANNMAKRVASVAQIGEEKHQSRSDTTRAENER